MKRKILALLCIVALTLSLASCSIFGIGGDNGDDTCEHTYSERWSTNSTEHWHAATCEHAELKADVASHDDADQDGICDVCAYTIGHEHTYADTWTSDETHHWKVATCSHPEEKGELAAHVDSESDGTCDVCSAHVHVINIYGNCSVCNKKVADIDVTDIKDILPLAVAKGGKVTGGNIKYENTCFSVADGSEVDLKKDITYKLGKGAASYVVVSDSMVTGSSASDTEESWFELDGETVFGVYRTTVDGEVGDFTLNTADSNNLTGYYFAVSTLADAYGAESLLDTLYSLSQSEAAYDYVYTYADGTYSFTFNYLYINSDTGEGEGDHVDYYEVSVSFTVYDSGVLSGLTVVCDCYTNSVEDEADIDYTYDPNSGTITLKDTAVADVYTFIITQDEGTRTYVSEHPKSEFIPEDFDLFTDAELTSPVVNSTVNVTVDKAFFIYVGNCTPVGTSVSYLADSFTVTCDSDADFYLGVDPISASVIANMHVAGTYTFVLTAGDIVKEITVIATAPAGPDTDEIPEGSVSVYITDNNTYVDVIAFTAPFDGDYTFTVPAGCGAWDKASCDSFSGAQYVDPNLTADGGTFTVKILAGDTYRFYVCSPNKNVTVYLQYTVSEYTGNGEIYDNTGSGGNVATGMVSGVFTGTNTYHGECTLVVDTAAGTLSMDGQEFSYVFEDGVVTVYMNGNALPSNMLGVTVGSDGAPTSFVYNGNTFTVSAPGEGGGSSTGKPHDKDLVIGANTIVATAQDYANEAIYYNLVVTAEGTYVFSSSSLMVVVYDLSGMRLGMGSVYLAEGTYSVAVVLSYTTGAGTYSLNVEYVDPNPSEPDGSDGNPYVLDSVPTDITLNITTDNKVYYLYTADASGYIYITLSAENDSWCDIYLFADGNVDGSDSDSSLKETVVKFAVTAGNTYRIGLGVWDTKGEVTFSLAFSAE